MCVAEFANLGREFAVAQGSAPDGFLTRTLKNAEIIRVPGGLVPAREALAEARADVYGENIHLAYRIAADLPGATVLDGRFNVVQMSIAVPKSKAAALPTVNDFIPPQPRGWDRCDGYVRRADNLVSPALWIADHGVRPATYSVVWRHSASERRMDRKSGHGSMRVGTGSPLSHS
jgi:hypothetical protein